MKTNKRGEVKGLRMKEEEEREERSEEIWVNNESDMMLLLVPRDQSRHVMYVWLRRTRSIKILRSTLRFTVSPINTQTHTHQTHGLSLYTVCVCVLMLLWQFALFINLLSVTPPSRRRVSQPYQHWQNKSDTGMCVCLNLTLEWDSYEPQRESSPYSNQSQLDLWAYS